LAIPAFFVLRIEVFFEKIGGVPELLPALTVLRL
jgi:hypothetical protein